MNQRGQARGWLEPGAPAHLRRTIERHEFTVTGTSGPDCLSVREAWLSVLEADGICVQRMGHTVDRNLGRDAGGYLVAGQEKPLDHHWLVVGNEFTLFDPAWGLSPWMEGQPSTERYVADDGTLFLEWRERQIDLLVVTAVVQRYLESHDYNGVPVEALGSELHVRLPTIRRAVARLVTAERIVVVTDEMDVNPFILRTPSPPPAAQIKALRSRRRGLACVYPTQADLEPHVQELTKIATPYAARLMLGAPQLEAVPFEPAVLDRYMRDPRFVVQFHDYTGMISVGDDADRDPAFPEKDKILLQTFGIGYRPNGVRVVMVFLRYLADLTPEHQRVWQASEVPEECRMVGDYFRNAILGEWGESISVYQALLMEQTAVNTLASGAGMQPLFRETFERDRPPAYHPLLIPTLRAYLEFVSVLDKMLSENINIKFFPDHLRFDADGKEKGSITLLGEWLRAHWRPQGNDPIPEIIDAIRSVRSERQRPAHKIEQDRYDTAYYDQQRELIGNAWNAVNLLRQMLARHPAARHVALPNELDLPVAAY